MSSVLLHNLLQHGKTPLLNHTANGQLLHVIPPHIDVNTCVCVHVCVCVRACACVCLCS